MSCCLPACPLNRKYRSSIEFEEVPEMSPELSCEDHIGQRWQHPLSRMKGTIESHNLAMRLN